MKKFEVALTVLQLPLDYFLLVLAGLTAYFLRFTDTARSIRPVIFNLPWNQYWPLVMGVAFFWIIIFALTGLYAIDANRKMSRDIGRVILACLTGFSGITIYTFFSLQRFDSRFLVLTGTLIAMVYVISGRLIMRGIKALLYRAGIGLRRVVIIGDHTVAESLKNIFTSERRWGYVVVGEFSHLPEGNLEKLEKLQLDELFFTDPKAHEQEVLRAIEFANSNHLAFKYSADLFDTFTSNMSISAVAGIPIIELKRTPLEGWGAIAKRFFDIIFSSLCIMLFSPLMLLIALAIKLDSKGPVFFVYERIGQYGRPFTYFKFRSMIDGAHTLRYDPEFRKQVKDVRGWTTKNPIVKYENDPRVTRVGKFLRTYSLDELAEFFLVLIGSMSLVGPRPHEKEEVEKYQKHHKKVLTLKPGMTGMAQISGRSSLSFDEEVRLDTFYIENWSLFLDAIIVIKTPFVVLKKDGIGT